MVNVYDKILKIQCNQSEYKWINVATDHLKCRTCQLPFMIGTSNFGVLIIRKYFQ